jgi:hypothetical protein
MKSFFKSFLLSCFFSQIAFALPVAEIEPNNSDSDAQVLSTINTDTSMEVGPGTLTKSTDEKDYYKVNITTAGTLSIYVTAAESTDVYLDSTINGDSCEDSKVLTGTGGNAQLDITGSTTVCVVFDSKYNGTHSYGFDLVFQSASPPVAVEDTIETLQDTAVDIDVTANDTDDGSIDKTTVTIVSAPSHGTITNIDGTTGIVTYTPDAGYTGTDYFTYTVKDNKGNPADIDGDVLVVIKVPTVAVENCDTGSENAYRDFCLRKQIMLPGDMLTIGNTVLVAPDSDNSSSSNPNANCSTYTNGDYIDDATNGNNSYKLCQYFTGTSPATSARLDIPDPDNSEVEWAGLYWQALVHEDTDLATMQIRIKNGNGTYESIGYDKLNYIDHTDSNYDETKSYAAFKDVTTILTDNNWKDGNYTVADIPVYEGQVDNLGTYGAWSLVVIYKNSTEAIRSFSVFDGWKKVEDDIDATAIDEGNVPIGVSGFYTPKAGDINAKVSIFAAEGDKNIANDKLFVERKSNTSEQLLPAGTSNSFDSRIDGVAFRIPNPTNNNGIDIHTYELGTGYVDVLEHEQSDIFFRFTSTQDTYWPSMLAFSTEVYTPSFCYDYAYQQNGIFITEENNDTLRKPRITGQVTNGDDLDVTLFIRNQEDSDVSAKNLKLSITDINSTQAIYKSNTVSILNADEVVALPVPDSDLIVSNTFIKDIDYADVAGNQYIYSYYTLTPNLPSALAGDINISLNVSFTYDLVLPLQDGSEITIPSTSTAGGTNLPLCSAGNFEFIKKEAWGIFNVVDTDIYSLGEYYNIPTQVVRRVGNFSVVAYDSNSSNVNNTETPDTNSTTLVGIDMIDAGAFHDILATCSEATAGISPILWMNFKNSGTLDLKQEITNAIADDRLTINSVDEYFPNAVKSAAFRIHYLTTNDGDEDLIKTEDAGGGNVKLLNFTELVQDIGTCKQPVRKFPNSDLTTIQVPVACANAGNAGLNPFEVQRCMECLFGYNTTHVCSRDNFSIRPESFNIKINDTNQSNVVKIRLEDGVTGVAAPNGVELNLAAGYQYNFEVNATTHVGNESAPGYSRYFNPLFPSDYNATLLWEPTDPAVNPFCNDTNDTSLAFNMVNGEIDALGAHSDVGEYRFNIVDKGWTKVDWDINGDGMKHHRDNPTYYKGGATGLDCDITSSAILPNASMATVATGAALSNLNGCTIDSNNHDNIDANIKYRDYNMVLHPYDFNISTVQYNRGMLAAPAPIGLNTTHYVYMNDVKDDTNMSIRYTGQIRAVGADNVNLSNFVADCYARDIKMTINTSALPATPVMNYRLEDRNITGSIISTTDSWFSAGGTASNVIMYDTNFTKAYEGVSDMTLSFNLDRTVNNAINPITINHDDFNVSCKVPLECYSKADMLSNYVPESGLEGNATITYIYGRVHTPRQRVANPNPAAPANAQIPLYYEFYCDDASGCDIATYSGFPIAPISPFALLSQDDVRWYSQELHNVARDGNATTTRARSLADDVLITTKVIDAGAQSATYTYNGNRGYPYKATIELSAPAWLLYNRFDPAATVNDFELEFFSTGRFAGTDESGVNMDANTSINVNRRIQW